MSESPSGRDPVRLLETIAVQLETNRRAFVRGNVIYAVGNFILAGLALQTLDGGRAWIPATVAFLGNVFYALSAEWELRWHALWRREIPRLESESGAEILSRLGPGPRDIGRWMRWLAWGIAVVWLVLLLVLLGDAGLFGRFGPSG